MSLRRNQKTLFLSPPGLHYIGQVHENSLLRIAFDQISEGQLEFQELKQHFDTIQIGLGDDKRDYTIFSGKTEMKAHLLKQFPDDTEAIETFFKIMKVRITNGQWVLHNTKQRFITIVNVCIPNRSQLRRPTTWQLWSWSHSGCLCSCWSRASQTSSPQCFASLAHVQQTSSTHWPATRISKSSFLIFSMVGAVAQIVLAL